MTSFSAEILRFEPDDKKHAYAVLSQTAFHPKSGGQPSDRGTLSSLSGELSIKKVMMTRGVVVHWGKMSWGDRLEGQVEGKLDFGWRSLLMRRHTAGHLLDNCIGTVTKVRVKTTDSWLEGPCWVGYIGNPPSQEQLTQIEAMANRLILEGRAVTAENVSKEDLMRRAPDAPNIARLPDDLEFRLVTIEGQKSIPCGGTHVRDISEIRSVKISKVELVSQGYRISYEVS